MHEQKVFELLTFENGKHLLKKTEVDRKIKRGWIKFIRDDMSIPLPSSVKYANQIPGIQISCEKFQLDYGDIVIEGYEMCEFKGRNGVIVKPWVYRIFGMNNHGNVFCFERGWRDLKNQMRTQGLDKKLLDGTGKLAALVRVIHATRRKIILTKPTKKTREKIR
jgi:hypothetical protein